MRDWVAYVRDTYYIIGSVAGPHPYPMMVRDFQSVIGREAKRQILKQEGRLPDAIIACVGGGSNAMGIFYPFRNDTDVELIGVEAAGNGIATGMHAATISAGSVGVLHGSKSYLLQDEDGSDPRGPLDGGRARLPRRGAGAQPTSNRQGGPTTSPSRTARRWRPSAPSAPARGSSPPWRARTPSPTP